MNSGSISRAEAAYLILPGTMTFLPELLAPSGNLEKLKVGVLYGADAVYLSGLRFGLRAGAGNFSNQEIELGADFARKHNVKIYVAANMFFHDDDFDGLGEFCSFLEEQGVSGVIVSDIGVAEFIKSRTSLSIHVSTQSSCLNTEAAHFWKELGADRIIVGRELSIEQTKKIKETVGIAVEMFVHGAMCMAYSGHCVISNFTAGRDSNRGGCVQSCRNLYRLRSSDTLPVPAIKSEFSNFMSSKDMLGISYVPQFVDAKIDSLKVEGRMKSPLYVATTTSAYRKALEAVRDEVFSIERENVLASDLNSLPHRGYIPGFFETPPSNDSIYQPIRGSIDPRERQFAGLVTESTSELVAVRANATLKRGASIEFLTFNGLVIQHQLSQIYDGSGAVIGQTVPGAVFYIPKSEILSALAPFTVARARCHEF